MSGNIPYAQPYPWRDEKVAAREKIAAQALKKRKFVGAGVAMLQKESLGQTSKMSTTAKSILVNLMHQYGMEVPPGAGNYTNEGTGEGGEAPASKSNSYSSNTNVASKTPPKHHGVPSLGTAEDEIVKNAQAGKYSVFKTILSVLENEKTLEAVPTQMLLSKVCLVVPPRAIPGSMDAKDIVMAALQFLSSSFDPKSNEMMKLPLVKAVQRYSDLDKRHYQKSGTWKLDEIDDDKLFKLEGLYLSSPASWKWLGREAFCPRLTKDEEATFFLKGTVPESAAGKTKQAPRKRKATTSPSPSVARSETPATASAPLVIVTASVDLDSSAIAKSVDEDESDDDDGPIVEATILEDDDED
ncbi:MAG: hypothetical protein SGILL_000504 [Bacillariaceae sp.]